MAGPTVRVNIRYNNLGRMQRRLPLEASRAMRKAIYAAKREAQARCPVDTGTLKNSIAEEGAIPGSLSMTLFTSSGYGGYVNFGTRHMAAQPFMTSAARVGTQVFIAEAHRIAGNL